MAITITVPSVAAPVTARQTERVETTSPHETGNGNGHVARGGRDRGLTMNERLLDLLEYRVVLGVLVTSLDGLVVAHAGLSPDDAEFLAAASAAQPDDAVYSYDTTHGGILHVYRGHDMRLIVLTETDVPTDAVAGIMQAEMHELEASIAV
jgi:predicted regulator of Ras-like GTPase activity (Roadblock/LC7/MglB family)